MKTDAFVCWLAALLSIMVLSSTGCNDSSSSGSSGTLTIVHATAKTALMAVGGDTIDTVEIIGSDSSGKQIYGPVREAYSSRIVRNDVPLKVKSVTVDYLRNQGYPLLVTTFATDFEDDGVHTVQNPLLAAHETPKTVWKAQMKKNCLLTVNDDCFKIKGVCYSPSPIGYDGSKFPALGDLFWDSYPEAAPSVWNWYSLWGYGEIKIGDNTYYARDDLKTIRGLNANAIRVYAMMSRQPINVGTEKKPQYAFLENSGDDSKNNHFKHTQFLDKCYNNGTNPIYVLVGIPMAKALFQKGLTLATNEQNYWEYMLDETTKDLAKHPAVLGFTIMNEEDAEPWSHTSGNYQGSDKSDQFYYRAVKYGKIAKTNAPDKLVGWATHENPQLYRFAAETKFTDQDALYLAELSKVFDYWGMNTYQAEDFESVLGNKTIDKGYTFRQLPDSMKKPVIFTEVGWPASGRDSSGKTMIDTAATTAKTEAYLKRMLPQAFSDSYSDLFAGLFYFEFSDEWWKSGNENEWNITSTAPEKPETIWPNKWADEEGFGLFSAKRGAGKELLDPIWCGGGPCQPIDELVPRLPLTNALTEIFKNAK